MPQSNINPTDSPPSVYYGHMVLSHSPHQHHHMDSSTDDVRPTPFARAPSILSPESSSSYNRPQLSSLSTDNTSNIHQLYHPYHQSPPVYPPDPPSALARFLSRAPSQIGRPVTFVESEYYQNRTIRAEITEIQGARLGRKCADPPTSTSPSRPRTDSPRTNAQPGPSGINASNHGSPRSSEGAGRTEKQGRKDRRPLDPPPVVAMRLFEILHQGTPDETERELPANEEEHSMHVCHVDLFALPDSHDIDNPPPTLTVNLSSIRTEALIGSTYNAAAYILDQQGHPAAYFVFRDLSVKSEGVFFLRYRMFDLHSFTAPDPNARLSLPILAECFGRPFRVYSTKLFPGLDVSTSLTMHLNRWGVKVNFREGKRVRKGGAVGKKVLKDEEEDDDNDDESDDRSDGGRVPGPSRGGGARSRARTSSGGKSKTKKINRKNAGISVFRGAQPALGSTSANGDTNVDINGDIRMGESSRNDEQSRGMSEKAKGKRKRVDDDKHTQVYRGDKE